MSCEILILNSVCVTVLFNILQACTNLNNNGTCENSCPVENIIVDGRIVPNPAFRVEAGTQCIVPPCPGMAM